MRTVSSVCCVTALAIGLTACDGGGASSAGLVSTAPSTSEVSASFGQPTAPQAPAFVNFLCTAPSQVSAVFDIVVVASTTMNLTHVTIRLIDGSTVGGPMVTFPQPALTTQFGTTRVLAGVARTFTFRPQFSCGARRPHHVEAQLALLDPAGAPHRVTVVGPWR